MAIRLYERLGYVRSGLQMRKSVGVEDASR